MAFQDELKDIFGELETPKENVPQTFQQELEGIFATPATTNEIIPIEPQKKGVIASLAEKLKKQTTQVVDFFFRDKAFEAREAFEAKEKKKKEQAEAENYKQQRKKKKKFVVLPDSLKIKTEQPISVKAEFPKVAEPSPGFAEVDIKAPVRRQLGAFAGGALSSLEGIAGAVEWVGVDRAKPVADKLKDWSEALQPEDPNFALQVTSGFGSAAVFFLPGFGFMRAAGFFGVTSPRIAALFGNSAATALEASTEAGLVYRELIEQGKSRNEASLKALGSFASNAVLIFLTNKFGLFDPQKETAIKRTLESALLEGGQEGAQQVISNLATNRPLLEGVKESVAIGAIIGGSLASVLKIPQTIIQQKLDEEPDPSGADLKIVGEPSAIELQKEFEEKKPKEEEIVSEEKPIIEIPREELSEEKKVTPELEPLAQEARKYKSAEEFINSQELLYHGTSKESAAKIRKFEGFREGAEVGLKDLTGFDVPSNKAVSLTKDLNTAKLYVSPRPEGGVGELLTFRSDNLKVATLKELKELEKVGVRQFARGGESPVKFEDFVEKLRRKGFDGFEASSPHDELIETVVFNKDKLKLTSKSQLTDFYNQVVSKPKAKPTEKEIVESLPIKQPVKIPKVKPKKVFTEEQQNLLAEIEQKTTSTEEILDSSPLKALETYKVSRGDGGWTLPEAGVSVEQKFQNMGREELRNKNKIAYFKRFGDDIITEVGYSDINEATEAFERYMDLKKEIQDSRKERGRISEEAEEEFTEDQLDKINASIQTLSNTVDIFVRGAGPVETEGKIRKSRAFQRVKERLGNILGEDPLYNKLNLAEDTALAIKFVQERPDSARKIAFGMATPPPGLTETGISIAYSEKMLEDGRLDEFNDAEQSRSLRQTRRGQEIVAEKERVNENSPDHFVQKVIRARLR